MAGINKVILIGNVGQDPEIRAMQSGDEIAQLSIATSESWKDKNSGERREKTEWHRVVIFSKGLVSVVQSYVKKGTKLYIEGKLQTRKWTDQSGQDKYTTEIVLTGYDAKLVLLSSKSDGSASRGADYGDYGAHASGNGQQSYPSDVIDDDIPFN